LLSIFKHYLITILNSQYQILILKFMLTIFLDYMII